MGSPNVRDSQESRIWQNTSECAATFYPGISGRVHENGDYDKASPRSYDLDSDASVWNANGGKARQHSDIFTYDTAEKVQRAGLYGR